MKGGSFAKPKTFDTCEWVGRFEDCAIAAGKTSHLIPRKDIKKHFCGNTTTNDKYIRDALIDRLEIPEFVFYTKNGQKKSKKGGKLYGISGHLWAALAVAVYVADMGG